MPVFEGVSSDLEYYESEWPNLGLVIRCSIKLFCGVFKIKTFVLFRCNQQVRVLDKIINACNFQI